jgi:hypothetical protein
MSLLNVVILYPRGPSLRGNLESNLVFRKGGCIRYHFALALVLSVAPATYGQSVAPSPDKTWIQMKTAIGDDYFDGTSDLGRVRRHFKIAREAGVMHLRCAFSWNAIEMSRGKYNWAFWDMLVREAERAKIELIPYVAYTPEWAADSSDEFWSQPPQDPHLYADFMSALG